jgi:hypothetical protein
VTLCPLVLCGHVGITWLWLEITHLVYWNWL